jgi:hypothetical protein
MLFEVYYKKTPNIHDCDNDVILAAKIDFGETDSVHQIDAVTWTFILCFAQILQLS